MEEVWKDVQGYEGLYMVSNLGNVKSMNYANRGYARNLVPKTNNSGRLWVELAKNGARKPLLVHRLVATAFIPNPENFPEINHIDENPKNNEVRNLEWCTHEYNNRIYREHHPLRPRTVRWVKKSPRLHLKVNQIDEHGNIVKQWPNSRDIFKETGMSDWSISECCRGKRKTAYGFKWQYAI